MIDETTSGGRFEAPALQIETERITLRDLIALRVRAEVRHYNNERGDRFYGLIQPSDLEQMVNGPAVRRFRPIDADRQVEVALKAFREGRFLVLLPDRQAESLDEALDLGDGDEVGFLRMVPLVGG
ncbi:MAG: hypothetical protein EOP01_07895 [Propionibacteriaceae bacterium]|nr:MAG: hypothetical protein EOP01_07895 [Propionibacteriaceae bacterium]